MPGQLGHLRRHVCALVIRRGDTASARPLLQLNHLVHVQPFMFDPLLAVRLLDDKKQHDIATQYHRGFDARSKRSHTSYATFATTCRSGVKFSGLPSKPAGMARFASSEP